jgi:endonuclease YncB( thermonuclease family)
VRLEGIDCPERGQPFGRVSRTFTSKKCFGRDVEVRLKGQDQYGRDLGEVLVG